MVGADNVRIIAAFAALSVLQLLQSCVADAVQLTAIKLPPGFAIEVFAEVEHARSMALGADGTVFVGSRRGDSVYAVVPQDGGEAAVIELVSGLSTPNGIAYFEGDLFVAEIHRILRFANVDSRLHDMPEPQVLPVELPGEKHHGPRYIGFGPDRHLYVGIGAPCNVCERDGFGQILRMRPDGTAAQSYATGIRNTVGFTWHPETGDLWFTDNGRDMLGDDLPPDELNRAPSPGMHFGFPYCHAGKIPDPQFGGGRDCDDYTAPVQDLGPHVAALGVTFYTGSSFPAEYRGQVFIAEHGSWNRSKRIGYRVSLVRLESGAPVGYEVFAEGWLQGESVSGRPVDLLVIDDGSLLVSDDHAGRIYRIYYQGND